MVKASGLDWQGEVALETEVGEKQERSRRKQNKEVKSETKYEILAEEWWRGDGGSEGGGRNKKKNAFENGWIVNRKYEEI